MIGVYGQQALPIDALIPDVLASLERTPNLVIEAEPGAEKDHTRSVGISADRER